MKALITVVFLALMGGAFVGWGINEFVVSDDVASLNTEPLSSIELIDQDDQAFSLRSLYGKTVVLNFMFNGCSPVQTVGLRRVFLDHELDSKDKGIVFLSISIAPETDTPTQLKKFADQYGIDAKNWRLGITDRTSLDVLLDIFNAGKPVTGDPNAHLNTVFLISPNGQMEKVYTGFPIAPSVVYSDLAALVDNAQNDTEVSSKSITAIRPAENTGPPDQYGHWIGRNQMTSSSVELVWSKIEANKVTYRIHRFERNAGFNPDTVILGADSEVYAGDGTKWIDRNVKAKQFYTYVLAAEVDGNQLPRRWTEALSADDTEPPTAITGLNANVTEEGVLLSWNRSADNVEFAAYSVSIVEENRLKYIGGGADIEQTSFLDNRPQSGLITYAVVAVDFHNNRTEAATIEVSVSR